MTGRSEFGMPCQVPQSVSLCKGIITGSGRLHFLPIALASSRALMMGQSEFGMLRLVHQLQSLHKGTPPLSGRSHFLPTVFTSFRAPVTRQFEFGMRYQVPVDKPPRDSSPVDSVAFSPDRTCIASGSSDRGLQIRDSVSGTLIGTPLIGHFDVVRSVAFSPDSTYIISGSNDKTVRIWDAVSGAPIGKPLKGHSNVVRSVAISPDGTRIVSGSHDNDSPNLGCHGSCANWQASTWALRRRDVGCIFS